jgi:hypothetical protein
MTKISGSGSISQRHESADLDPHKNVMDPQHCPVLNLVNKLMEEDSSMQEGTRERISVVDPDQVDPKSIGFPGSESVILNYGYGSLSKIQRKCRENSKKFNIL